MASWSNEGKPSWLTEDNNNDEERPEHRRSTSSRGSFKPLPTDAKTVSTRSNNDSFEDDDEHRGEDSIKKQGSRCASCNIPFALISAAFAAGFIYGAWYFKTDGSFLDSQWVAFFYCQATVACCSILSRLCCRGCFERFITLLAGAGLAWSFALIIITTLNYKKTLNADGEAATFEGYYNDVTQQKDDSAFELAYALVGAMSGLWHITLYCCCGMK